MLWTLGHPLGFAAGLAIAGALVSTLCLGSVAVLEI
jgi:hypothetical protein